jgi:Flp pilus assembly protein TadD
VADVAAVDLSLALPSRRNGRGIERCAWLIDMRLFFFAYTIALVGLTASLHSQESPRPIKAPVAPTVGQIEKLKAGVRLHDQGNFDGAIALYAEVLKENPDCLAAMFEIANSYHQKRDYGKALEYATLGTAYDSPELASFYLVIGSAHDDMGDAAKAIDAYKRGITLAPSSLLHFNLAISLERLNKDDEAKVQLKQAALLNPNHASTHAEIGKLFMRKGLASQGVLAISRFLVLEPASARTAEAYRAWLDVLRGSVSTNADGKMTMSVNPGTDVGSEGNFLQQDLLIGISRASAMAQSEGKTQAQILVGQLDGWLAMLASDKVTDRSAFAWSYYAPYFIELQKRGYTEPFVYWISQRTDLPGVREWVADPANRERVSAFVQWSRNYVWPKSQ